MSPLVSLAAGATGLYTLFIARSAFAADGRAGFTLFDDAMISMRYARNLAEGYGLVWNAGERVEGYTNPLWTLWMALIHACGASDERASLVVMIGGAVILLATAGVAARIAGDVFQSAGVATAAFALVAFNYALTFWTLRGMEVGLLALLVTLSLGLTLSVAGGGGGLPRENEGTRYGSSLVWLCVTLALAELTRRDAAVIHVALMAYLGWTMRGRRRVVVLTALAASLAVTLGSQLVFSAWYYGDPWPNTYYLKIEGVTLADRLRRGVPALMIVTVRNLLPALLAAAFIISSAAWRRVMRPVVLLASVVAIQGAYSAYVGGDAWEYMGYTNRYLTTIVPALWILAAAGIREVSARGGESPRRFVAILLATVGVRFLLEVALHLANRGVARGDMFFELHRTAWVATVLSLACASVVVAAALWMRPGSSALRLAGTGPVFALMCAVWCTANGVPFGEWIVRNASSMSNDVRGAQAGLLVRRLTSPDTVVAVTSAGNVPYFSRRRTIDILGKSDPVIAHMAPVNAFVPGHNKWNLDHSIRDGAPDLVFGLPRAPGEVRYLVGLGYQSFPGMCFAKRDSMRVDHHGLWQALADLYPDAPSLPEEADAPGHE